MQTFKLEKKGARRQAMAFILLLGLVSLFGDITYEGARSITGPYLYLLGASATAVGFTSGLGEFVGYALRLLTGYLADRTGRYWTLTIVGYLMNLVAVPLLGLAGRWEAAASDHSRKAGQSDPHALTRYNALPRHKRGGKGLGVWHP